MDIDDPPTTRRRCKCLADAVYQRLVPVNAALLVRIGEHVGGGDDTEARTDVVKAWPRHEARRFLDHVTATHEPQAALWWFALQSGMRRGELLGLEWCDVDLDEHVVHVRRSWTTIAGQPTMSTPTSRRRAASASTAPASLCSGASDVPGRNAG